MSTEQLSGAALVEAVREECDRLEQMEAEVSSDWTILPTSHTSDSLLVRGDRFLASTQLPTEDVLVIVSARNTFRRSLACVRALAAEYEWQYDAVQAGAWGRDVTEMGDTLNAWLAAARETR